MNRSPESDSALPLIPDHTLLRPIGRGAYGEVWLARNVMGTWRAVKIVRRRWFESERPYQREFDGIQRYEPVSRTSGGLLHVLHAGRNDADGYFYYVMELADSMDGAAPPTPATRPASLTPASTKQPCLAEGYSPRTLRADLRRLGRLRTEDCLRLALDVTSGLGQLHRHGLVHRDVKPGNIIYVNGRAKLADIGLVTAEGEGRTFVGTEGYVPPEGPGTPPADLYALGIVLYEASTGFPPERFPDVPPEWITDTDGDRALELHEIILKAGEGQRERRYQSCDALQADLALLQSGQSVRHVRALQRRYARLRVSGIVGTLLLVCAIVVAIFAHYRARIASENQARETALRQQAQQAMLRSEAAELGQRQQLYTALLEQARATVRSGDLGQRVRALEAIRRASAISNTAELRGAALAALALPDLRFERELPQSPDTTVVRLDPDFQKLAVAHGPAPVEIRSVSDLRLLDTLAPSTNRPVFVNWWSRDARFLAVKRDTAVSGSRADIEVWDVAAGNRILLLRDVDYGTVAFHPRRPWMLAGLTNGVAAVWDLVNTNELVRFDLGHPPMLLQFSPDGERFVASYRTNQYDGWAISINKAANGELLRWQACPGFVAELAWHPTGSWIATADYSGAVQLLDSNTGEWRSLGRHKAQAVLVVFSPDGNYLFSGGWEREFVCWDLSRMERAFTLPLNSYRLQVRADGTECAIVSESGALQLHALERPSGHRDFPEDLGPRLFHAAFSLDGRWLAASGGERLAVWDLAGRSPAASSTEGADARLYFSPDGELFASRDNGSFRLRITNDAQTNQEPQLISVPFAQAPGFRSLCLVSNDVVLTGEEGTRILSRDGSEVAATSWVPTARGINGRSPDGRWLAIFQPFTPWLHIYRLPGFAEAATLTNHASIAGFEFSPSGDELAVTSSKVVTIWNTATWQKTRELRDAISLLYTPDGRTCWLSKDFRRAGLYDVHTLAALLPLPSGTLPLAVSPDGRYLAASVDSRRLQLWDLFEVRTALRELGLDW